MVVRANRTAAFTFIAQTITRQVFAVFEQIGAVKIDIANGFLIFQHITGTIRTIVIAVNTVARRLGNHIVVPDIGFHPDHIIVNTVLLTVG